MSNHPHDDLEPALRAMLADQHLDVQPRSDAVGSVLAGVDRARRRRATGYASVTTLAVATAIGAIALTGADSPQGIVPAVTPTTSATATPSPTPTPTPTATQPSTTAPSVPEPTTTPPPPTASTPPVIAADPVLEMLRPDGIGDVVLGSTPAEAYGTGTLAMYDPGTRAVSPWDGSAADSVCSTAGQAQRTTPDSALVWMDDSVGVTEIAIWPQSANPDVSTVDGLRLFDDTDRILELYPDARREDSPSSVFFYVENWGGGGNTLEIRDDFTGTVQGMSVVLAGQTGGCYE